jgi:hypothetical protein
MKSYKEQYQEIKDELEINQQEYRDRQNILLKKISDLQEKCPHDSTVTLFIENKAMIKCQDCSKMFEKRSEN